MLHFNALIENRLLKKYILPISVTFSSPVSFALCFGVFFPNPKFSKALISSFH